MPPRGERPNLNSLMILSFARLGRCAYQSGRERSCPARSRSIEVTNAPGVGRKVGVEGGTLVIGVGEVTLGGGGGGGGGVLLVGGVGAGGLGLGRVGGMLLTGGVGAGGLGFGGVGGVLLEVV